LRFIGVIPDAGFSEFEFYLGETVALGCVVKDTPEARRFES
jgi:hypothetical protein